MSQPEIKYDNSGQVLSVSHSIDGKPHRDENKVGLPAIIEYYKGGNKKSHGYYNNGVLHREERDMDGLELPAFIEWDQNGEVIKEQWYKYGKLHRTDTTIVRGETRALPPTILNNKGCITGEYTEELVNETQLRNVVYLLDDRRTIFREVYYFGGHIHNEDGPAKIEYYFDGRVEEEWFIKGVRQRDGLPSVVNYYPNGVVSSETYECDYIKHRDGEPADISYYDNGSIKEEIWYKNGKLHRDGAPAIIGYNKSGKYVYDQYYNNDMLHRENDLPAVIEYKNDGHKEEYYIKGVNHRTHGPACVEYSNNMLVQEIYIVNGRFHREDGPAVIFYTPWGPEMHYYYKDKTYTKAGLEEILKKKLLSQAKN